MEKKTPNEGYIKFNCICSEEEIEIPEEILIQLNYWRNFLRDKGWIGAYPDGIGYGNISVRISQSDNFYITGSATGNLQDLGPKHYSLVYKCDPAKNSIWCKGMTRASAESMSHYMIYKTLSEAGAVVHIHNRPLWDKYLDTLPSTEKDVTYGTPEMAFELARILKLTGSDNKRVIVMGGHEEGIISYGSTIEEAVKAMLNPDR